MHPNSFPTRPGRLPPGAYGHTRGVVKRNYAIMPPEGILDSYLPNYEKTTVRFQAAPVLGAKFAQAMLEIEPGGGTVKPVHDHLQHFFYVIGGAVSISIDGIGPNELIAGGYVYIPPNTQFEIRNIGSTRADVLGLKKPYIAIDLPQPDPIVSSRDAVPFTIHDGAEGRTWQHLFPLGDFRFDFEMNILAFNPGTYFPHVETHIMEHGLYMLEGQGMYLLGADWHETWAGDFIWMGPYCPQLFYPTGWTPSAYLLYKDVNRDVMF